MINNITLEYYKKRIMYDFGIKKKKKYENKKIKILFFYRLQKFKKKYL